MNKNLYIILIKNMSTPRAKMSKPEGTMSTPRAKMSTPRAKMPKPEGKYAVIAPISKNPKKPARIFYKEQEERMKHGLGWCWNDSTSNTAKKGELFAFYFHGERVVFHKILSVKSPAHRLPSWANEERNFLKLSDPLFTYEWRAWEALNGPQCNRKTYRTNLRIWKILYANMSRFLPNVISEKRIENFEEIDESFSLTMIASTAMEITENLKSLDFKISTILL